MKRLLLVLIAAFTVLTTGCVESNTVIKLNRDGSGTITATEIVTAHAQDLIRSMGNAKGGPAEEVTKLMQVDVEALKQEASKFGEGVTLLSAKKIETSDGGAGREVVYQFSDINKLSFEQNSAGKNGDEEPQPITFQYTPGKLMIQVSQNPDGDIESMQKAEQLQQIPPQMKDVLKGMAVRITLVTESRIKTTNALFPLSDGKGIALVDMNIGELVKNQPALTKFSGTKPSDRKAMQKIMKEFPFIHMENQENVVVEF